MTLRTALARVRRALHVLAGRDLSVPRHAHPRIAEQLRQQDDRLHAARAEIGALTQRVGELEADLDEQRAVGRRVAEIADVVAHLLVVAGRGDGDEFHRALDDYATQL